MKLICTIQQGNLTVADGSALSHRLYFDFVTRIGIDGKDAVSYTHLTLPTIRLV